MIDRKTKRPNQNTYEESLKHYKRYLKKAVEDIKFWKKVIKEWKENPPKKGDIYNKLQDTK